MHAYAYDPPTDPCAVPPWWERRDAFDLRIERAFTLPEVAERLGISSRQVEMHVADGSLPAIDVGRGRVRRDLRVLDEDLDAFVEARRVGADRPVRVAMEAAPDGYIARRAARFAAKGGTP